MAVYKAIVTLLPELTENELEDLRKVIGAVSGKARNILPKCDIGFTVKDVERASPAELKKFFDIAYLNTGRESWQFEQQNGLGNYSVGAWYSGVKSTEAMEVENVIKIYLKGVAD